MVAPIAGAMKYSIQDTAVALGLMAKKFIGRLDRNIFEKIFGEFGEV